MWLGAWGLTFVSEPAVVGDKYKTSPSDQLSPCNEPVVFMFLTSPEIVTNPSWLLSIFSVTNPNVFCELGSLLPCAKTTANLWPIAPPSSTLLTLTTLYCDSNKLAPVLFTTLTNSSWPTWRTTLPPFRPIFNVPSSLFHPIPPTWGV